MAGSQFSFVLVLKVALNIFLFIYVSQLNILSIGFKNFFMVT